MDKESLFAQLSRKLKEDLDGLTTSQRRAKEGAIHEENRAESDKDTRAIEANYLVAGLAQRAAEMASAVELLEKLAVRSFAPDEPIGLTALVELTGEDTRQYLLSPVGGGTRLGGDNGAIVVTPESPLGRSLLGKCSGDEVNLRLGGKLLEYEIESVS